MYTALIVMMCYGAASQTNFLAVPHAVLFPKQHVRGEVPLGGAQVERCIAAPSSHSRCSSRCCLRLTPYSDPRGGKARRSDGIKLTPFIDMHQCSLTTTAAIITRELRDTRGGFVGVPTRTQGEIFIYLEPVTYPFSPSSRPPNTDRRCSALPGDRAESTRWILLPVAGQPRRVNRGWLNIVDRHHHRCELSVQRWWHLVIEEGRRRLQGLSPKIPNRLHCTRLPGNPVASCQEANCDREAVVGRRPRRETYELRA